jgi:hypothetical protein
MRLALRAQVLFEKGDYTQIVSFPIWPIAVAMAAGSVFLLTGVLLHAARALRRAARPEPR